jgi:hypothetical protein
MERRRARDQYILASSGALGIPIQEHEMSTAKLSHGITEWKAQLPHAVYRVYGAAGQLLYIGCSYRPWYRLQGHRPFKIQQISKVTLAWYPDAIIALREEAAAILAERPLLNLRKDIPDRIGISGGLASEYRRDRSNSTRSDTCTCSRSRRNFR